MAEHDQAGDADLQLKKRARRRLIGAIALVLLAVIVLPMVMDREPRPGGPEIQVQIPSQTARMPAKNDGAKSGEPTPAPNAAVTNPNTKADNQSAQRPTASKSDPKPDVAPATASAPEARTMPELPPPSKTPPTTGAKPAEKSDPRALAALGEKAPAAGAHDQWVVQLGAYRDSGNVKVLVGKIKEMGIPVYTEKLDSPQGPRTRVRAGPFPDRDAATRAQSRIKAIGVNGPVAQKN